MALNVYINLRRNDIFTVLIPLIRECLSPPSFVQVIFLVQHFAVLYVIFSPCIHPHFSEQAILHTQLYHFIFCTPKLCEHPSISFSIIIFSDNIVVHQMDLAQFI